MCDMVKTNDALDYARERLAYWQGEWEKTMAIHNEIKAKFNKTIWHRWFKLESEGLSKWDEGWFNPYKRWQDWVNALEYHQALGHAEVSISPYVHAESFYRWAKQNGRP